MTCPNCGQKLKKTWSSCQKCGLPLNCPKCKSYIPGKKTLSDEMIIRCPACNEPLVSSRLKKTR